MGTSDEVIWMSRWGTSLPFPITEYRARQRRVRERLAERDLDVLLLVAPESMLYLTGYDSIEYFAYQVLFVPRDEDRTIILSRPPEQEVVRDHSLIDELHRWRVEQPPSPIEATVEILRANGWLDKRLELEKSSYYLSVRSYEALCRTAGREFEDASDIVPECRMRKSPLELEYIRRAAELADVGVEAVRDVLRPGVTELDLHAAALQAMVPRGCEYPAIPTIVGSGWRSSLLHATPTLKRVKHGDVVSFETAGVVNRYHATIGRTLCVGRPSRRVRYLYGVVAEAVAAAADAARPGVPVADVDRAAKAVFRREGLEAFRLRRTGYGISAGYPPSWLESLDIVEPDPHVLEPGMVFSIEPPLAIYKEGIGIKLIDNFVVTDTECVPLSRLDRGLIVV